FARVLQGEEILSGGHRPWIVVSELGLEFVIQGIARFFVPAKTIGSECSRIGDGRVRVKAPVGVHCQLIWSFQDFEHGFDAAQILGQDRKSTRLNSSHGSTSYAAFCLKKNRSVGDSHR